MLKKIPNNLSPELVKTLMEMGHGDEIVIADGNFPSAAISNKVIRADGLGAKEILESILELFPLDVKYSENQIYLMDIVKGDNYKPEIWDDYKEIFAKYEKNSSIKYLERFEFYEKSKKTFAIVATGETALYANIILKKGVVD